MILIIAQILVRRHHFAAVSLTIITKMADAIMRIIPVHIGIRSNSVLMNVTAS